MSRPTIRDVAREAGVGVGTVSRVLSGSPRVAETTRARVQAVTRRLGFRPNSAARGLKRGRSHVFEVIVPLFTRFFSIEVLRGIEEALAGSGYALMVRGVEQRAERNRAFGEARTPGQLDGGLLVSLTPSRRLIEQFRAARLPLVLIDVEHRALSSVAVDHVAGARLAVEHLIDLGHRRIALVGRAGDPFATRGPDAWQRGYRAALGSAGIAVRPEYERTTEFSPEASAVALGELVGLPEPPTAVFCVSDIQALGVLEAARELGRRVPDDLSVVGYNDIEVAHYVGLTTVRVPMRAMGRVGTELLLRGLEDRLERRPEHARLGVELVARRTSGAVRPG